MSATPWKAGRTSWLLAAALLAVPAMADAQVLTLQEALRRADGAAFANRIAAGQSAAQAGQALGAYRGILPTIRVESGYLATTDPLSAFGFVLRQRSVTPAAFAPSSLNNPSSIGNLNTGVVVEQPIFNADSWLGRKAAATASQATAAQERWTRAGTAVDVVRAYWGAVLATEQERMLRSALEAAQSHVRQAESLVQQGMATRSDALLASVKAGQVEAARLSATSEARLARKALALLMGEPAESTFTLPDALPSAEQVQLASSRAATESTAPLRRADVEAATLARDAAVTDARRASALYLPRLNGFGRLDWNAPTAPFGGKSAWTLGVMLSWSPFTGGSELAEIRAASGRQHAAAAMAEAAEASAGLDRSRTSDAVPLAQARMEIAGRGIAQSSEAHRIIGRKYEGGLATVTELLDAAAIETAAELGEVAARYELIVATAESRRAQGLDLSPLQDLEPLVNQ